MIYSSFFSSEHGISKGDLDHPHRLGRRGVGRQCRERVILKTEAEEAAAEAGTGKQQQQGLARGTSSIRVDAHHHHQQQPAAEAEEGQVAVGGARAWSRWAAESAAQVGTSSRWGGRGGGACGQMGGRGGGTDGGSSMAPLWRLCG